MSLYAFRENNDQICCEKILLEYDIIFLLPPLYWYGKVVDWVGLFISFIVSVMASVVACYVCKWLDSDEWPVTSLWP